jgi:hypothetical protein
LQMLHTHVQFEDSSVSIEAGLTEMLQRMESGRFRVLSHLSDWFDKFRLFHRKDGRVVKEHDDLLAARRYDAVFQGWRVAGVLRNECKEMRWAGSGRFRPLAKANPATDVV